MINKIQKDMKNIKNIKVKKRGRLYFTYFQNHFCIDMDAFDAKLYMKGNDEYISSDNDQRIVAILSHCLKKYYYFEETDGLPNDTIYKDRYLDKELPNTFYEVNNLNIEYRGVLNCSTNKFKMQLIAEVDEIKFYKENLPDFIGSDNNQRVKDMFVYCISKYYTNFE